MERKEIVAQLKKDGAVEVKGLKIQSIKFTEVEDYDRVCLTVSPEVDAYVADDKGGFVKGKTNRVYTFPSILRAIIAEDAKAASIRKVICDNELIASLVLEGSKIDVLCEEVGADVVYHNPFRSDNATDKCFGHDTIVHHITKLEISNEGYEQIKQIHQSIINAALMNRKK